MELRFWFLETYNFRTERAFKIHLVLLLHFIEEEIETQTAAVTWGVMGSHREGKPCLDRSHSVFYH